MSETTPVPEPQPPASSPAPAAPPRRSGAPLLGPLLVLLAALLAAGLAGYAWLDTRERIGATQEELARRLRAIEEQASQARSVARDSAEVVGKVDARIAQLESQLAESRSRSLALESQVADLAGNREEWQLAEIEQMLAIASQQLQLAGNVRAALLALQLAQARLERADRPQFAPVRQALARDIERLAALAVPDLAGLSARIDALVAGVDALPLVQDSRLRRDAQAKPAAPAEEGNVLARLGAEIWRELRQLVVVRRMDSAEPPLLAPTQAYFLRENLRLRLLNARVSLLIRDEAGYRADLRAAQDWVRRYFDADAPVAAHTLAQLEELLGTSISLEVPSISESLEAVRSLKARGERKPG